MRKKVLILGGGPLQIPLIRKAKEKGCKVYLSDYYESPPGKALCDGSRQISTFSVEDNYCYAREENVDFILTIGTDQPVYTAAAVSEKLGLPHPISEELARLSTNKYYMKTKMIENDIPTPHFRVASRIEDISMGDLKFPLVMKPVDSQGQRGIFVLNGTEKPDDIRDKFRISRECSLTSQVIFEEFYKGDEITVNCWVKDGRAFILMNTDRLHYDDAVALGICKQQRYPSKFAASSESEIKELVQRMVDAFEIKNGPLYIQMVLGTEGAKFIEFGYRIGGGFESEIIPRVTGIDILDLYFSLVTEGKNHFDPGKTAEKARLGSIFFMFTKTGVVGKIKLPQDFYDHNGRIYIREGDRLDSVENATSRVGCFDFYTNEPRDYDDFVARFDSEIAIYDNDGKDLLIHNLWE